MSTDTLRAAAQAVLTRWDSPQWEWTKHSPTADLMHDLRAALAAEPAAAAPAGTVAWHIRIRGCDGSADWVDLGAERPDDVPPEADALPLAYAQTVPDAGPVAWMWQHDETGRTGFVDAWQLENGWRELNPRLHVVTPLYAGAAPAAQQAEPLSKLNAEYWQRHRADILEAIDRAGFRLVSDADGFWLSSLNPVAAAHPQQQAADMAEKAADLRRALEVIAVGDSADPVRDAGDELVALGYWRAEAVAADRAAHPQQPAQPASRDEASTWWALVMGAAASIEDAANCLRDPDAKRQADGAAKHYRDAAQALWTQATSAPAPAQQPAQPLTWQPIETAPKDGRKVVLAYVNRNSKPRSVMARWLTDEQAAETDGGGVGLEGGWYECIDNWDDYTEVAIHEGEPAHWMRLPAAPAGITATQAPTTDKGQP